jgi:hypothetical protein
LPSVAVGDNIDAYCLKCKLVLAHIILFKVAGTVSRVKCKTCGAEHKYRGTKAAAKKSDSPVRSSQTSVSRKSVTAKVTVNDSPIRWDLMSRNMQPGTQIKEYSLNDSYRVKDVINHTTFGVGFVEKVASDKSMYVLFSDSIKLLAMNIS